MNKERINQLEVFLSQDPADPFTRYALAIEYLEDKPNRSRELFEELLKDFPDYIATYYHAAALLASQGEIKLAEKIYQLGIAKAEELKEFHALKELKSAYLNFQFEND